MTNIASDDSRVMTQLRLANSMTQIQYFLESKDSTVSSDLENPDHPSHSDELIMAD